MAMFHELLRQLGVKLVTRFPPPLSEAEQLEKKLAQLSRSLRNVPGKVELGALQIDYVDAPTACAGYRYLIQMQVNDFYTDKEKPFILDCGANIGFSSLRFKQLYPQARIIAFEPEPTLCEFLRKNLKNNQASDVKVVEAAVWIEETEVLFNSETIDGGYIVGENITELDVPQRLVKAIRLADYLNEPVDFIKLDIEGAELQVLRSVASKLLNVEKMVIEVHYRVDNPSVLAEIIKILEGANFCVSIVSPLSTLDQPLDLRKPFVRNTSMNADVNMALYAWRNEN